MENVNLNEAPADAKPVLAEFYCPCCGLDTEQLHEGYCKPCLEQKQYELDAHNNQHDRWGKLSYEQRNFKISGAIKLR